jgi:hypothetical protein
MEKSKLKIGDEVWYFKGHIQPEKVKITGIHETLESGIVIFNIDKKDIVTDKNMLVPDFYLYKTTDETLNAIRQHIYVLNLWKPNE